MPKISIIIPVYNAEKYLEKCLDSVCNQTLKDIEIICINDCSTDSSLNILRDYAQKDSRIKIIDFKENKGPAIARNLGIDEANGEYIAFLDSDDYPETSEFYEKLYFKAKETGADVVKGAYKDSDAVSEDNSINEKIKEDKNNFCSTYCSAIFNSNLIKGNNIHFPELRDMEDPVFAFNCALKANAVEVVDNLNLIVTQRDDSITKLPITIKQVKDKLEGLKIIFNLSQISNQPYVLSYWFTTVIADSLKANNPEINELLEKTCLELYALKKNDAKFIENLNCLVSSCDSSVFNFVHNLLIKVIKNEIEKHEVISFDIFDTLLLRPFWEPAGVFEYLERKYNAPNFLKVRGTTEKYVRAINSLRHKGQEDITYDMIYDKMPEAYKHFKNIELNLENDTLIANPDMKDIFNYAVKLGKKIIIVSDMYLSMEVLENFLKNKGFNGFSKLYVSSEIKKCKHTCNLFKYILEDLNVKPEQMLHIGDNMIADVKSPKKLGISALHYKSLKEQFCDRYPSIKNISRLDLQSKNMLGLRILHWHKNKNDIKNYWEELGYNQGGPLAIAFLSNILEIIKYKNLTDLYFLARDGYLFKKLYDIIYNSDTMPKPHYIYATRKLRKMCVDDNDCIKECEQTFEYKKYLKSIDRKGNRIGLVDTCAGGFSAQTLIEKLSDDINYFGIYLVANTNFKYDYVSLSGKTRFIIDEFMNWDIFEILFSSPEYPVEAIKDCKPVFRTNNDSCEEFQKTIYPHLEKGMMRFVEEYIDIFGLDNTSIDMENVFKLIIDFWNNFSEEDVYHLGKIFLPQNQSQTEYLSLIAKNKYLEQVNKKGLILS